MISQYEIRENSITQDSVFLLLLKADKEGRDSILRELSAFCKLLDVNIKGFDYVFELSGITDDTMLEKLRGKIDLLAASVQNVINTFDSSDKTSTITVASAEETLPQVEQETIHFESGESSHNLDEKRISLPSDEEQSAGIPFLKIMETEPALTVREESILKTQNKEIFQNLDKLSESEKASSVEEENKTIISYTPEQIKDVSISIDKKEKKNFFGGLFGKFKAVLKNKKNETPAKNPEKETLGTESNNLSQREQSTKEKASFSGFIQKAKEIKEEIQKEIQKEEVPVEKQPKPRVPNPFQNLGEGIIVKKNLLNTGKAEEASQKEKEDLLASPIEARLQVDDIFDAQTVCDFYANPEGEKNISFESHTVEEENPSEILKPSSQKESFVDLKLEEKEDSFKEVKLQREEKKDPSEVKTDSFIIAKPGLFSKEDIKNEEEKNIAKDVKINNGEDTSKEKYIETESIPPLLAKDIQQDQQGKAKPPQTKEEEDKKDLQKEEQISKNNMTDKKEKDGMQENSQRENNIKQNKEGEIIKQPVQNTFKKPSVSNIGKIDHTLHVAPSSGSIKTRNYPIEMPLIPTYTFANMDISPIRFAHAMGMATLDSLGVANNPFLLQGASGTGKTHFLSAMGYEISKKIPQDKILFTNGVRFSRGVQYFLEKGQKAKLDTFFSNAEVLIIDDIHLTAVNEHNREYISKVLNDFVKNKKQIILSSKYPPESLKRFEELVNFKFSLGAISELKIPNQTHFARLIKKMVNSASLNLIEIDQEEYFLGRTTSLGDVARDIKRVKVLNRRIESSGVNKLDYKEILNKMTGIRGENQDSEIVQKSFEEITALNKNTDVSWGNFGFFFPTSQIDKFRWVAFAFQEAAKELGIKGGFNYALKSAYSTEHIISAAFKIANICDVKGLKGAIILGPNLIECKEPIRENFYDILTHMLEVMMIRCGTINFEDIKKPSAYVKMLGDILK